MERFAIINVYFELVRYVVIFLFGYTAFDKLINWANTVQQMNQQLLPEFIKPLLPFLIPFLELLIALLLIIEYTKKQALLASGFLMACFTTYVAVVLFNDFSHIPCSCGGIIRSLTWEQHLVLNSITTLLIFSSYLLYNRFKNSELLKTFEWPFDEGNAENLK